MSTALKALLGRLPLGPLSTIRQFTEAPTRTQRRLLRRLLQEAAETEWGRRYGFAEIAQAPDVVAAYQRRVPLADYERIREDVRRMRAGASDVMWPGRFKKFAVSSGTASAGKIIPVSEEMLAKTRDFGVGAAVNYLATTGKAGFLLGKHLTLPGRIEPDAQFPDTQVGEVSGLVAEAAPTYFRRFYQAVSNEVAFRPNWEKKLQAIAEKTATQDIRLLVMAPTWALVLFDRLIEAHNAQRKPGAPPAKTVGDVWPNLQVLISGGVALKSYRALIAARIGHEIDFIETYGASEGFIAFQNDVEDPAMLLHLDSGVFYEFVPMDALASEENPRRLAIDEVRPGVRYAVYVTTCSGLWSYALGDVVRFTEVFPHKIVVAGRTSEMMDKYGEAVFGEEARAALQKACEATSTSMTDFHIAPRPESEGALPGHQWLVEFEGAPPDAERFAEVIDEHLQAVNRHYQIRREARAFSGPEVVPVAPGTFYAWLQGEKEHISGQTKVPRMSEERRVADDVLAIAGNKR